MEYESKLSDIIASLPEVSGGFLYSSEHGLYANQTDDFADNAALLEVGRKLTAVVSMIKTHFQDTGGVRVSFKDLILCGIPIETDHWLFLLHQPSLSRPRAILLKGLYFGFFMVPIRIRLST